MVFDLLRGAGGGGGGQCRIRLPAVGDKAKFDYLLLGKRGIRFPGCPGQRGDQLQTIVKMAAATLQINQFLFSRSLFRREDNTNRFVFIPGTRKFLCQGDPFT